ncbi:IS66 family insertion sequence element accessory protein TnpB, partial [Escherichia coli]|nr:IS66 family insertion sequence element accessory protein TnpB [Escherichia coli]HDX7445877.1 IS66 family insertion sequence element accessory protein TnpB [Escherichia coli]
WPRKGDATWHLTQDEFHWLVCGLDWQQVKGHDLAKWVYQEEPEDAQSNAITQ